MLVFDLDNDFFARFPVLRLDMLVQPPRREDSPAQWANIQCSVNLIAVLLLHLFRVWSLDCACSSQSASFSAPRRHEGVDLLGRRADSSPLGVLE